MVANGGVATVRTVSERARASITNPSHVIRISTEIPRRYSKQKKAQNQQEPINQLFFRNGFNSAD